MSNIPSTAIHAAFTPIQRATNELIRARKVQADKTSHHTEDVEELDDTAVNSVEDRRQRRGSGQKERDKKRQEEPREKVEIARLSDLPLNAGVVRNPSQLDISA